MTRARGAILLPRHVKLQGLTIPESSTNPAARPGQRPHPDTGVSATAIQDSPNRPLLVLPRKR